MPQVYVGSRAAGDRVMVSLQRFIEGRLRLKVNATKSAVDKPWKRSFLGFTFSRKGARVKVAGKATDRLKARLRTLSRRTRGHTLGQVIRDLRETLLGWKAYFDLSEVLSPLRARDKWLRRRKR
jgi:RNA-directed DNA polymerase